MRNKLILRTIIAFALLLAAWVSIVIYTQFTSIVKITDNDEKISNFDPNNTQTFHDTQTFTKSMDKSTESNLNNESVGNNNFKEINKTEDIGKQTIYDSTSYFRYMNNEWVIVDCVKQKIIKCPHKLIGRKTTPLFYTEGTNNYLYGACRDVTVDTRSFCGF
ncbi:MAG: hypothetical protein OEZ39_16310 [Gammaproteobacteria bacterium]|nr:hypothetical protein [Gammaproteobacteria bacterium]MDH5653423.1 hypothetical protein [Gammaproteobacteria bacterium]